MSTTLAGRNAGVTAVVGSAGVAGSAGAVCMVTGTNLSANAARASFNF